TSNAFEKILPYKAKKFLERRFDTREYQNVIKNEKDPPSFDMVRASVNLTVASVLIAFATSLKLPLSTTYVTFMVAMGTSLADKAWGRESAVYRITGVITVIGGWFITAFTAFTAAFIIAILISYGGGIAIGIFIALALFILIRTHILFKKKESEKEKIRTLADEELHAENIRTKCTLEVRNMLKAVIKVLNLAIIGLTKEDRKLLKKLCKEVDKLNEEARYLKQTVHFTLEKLYEEEAETGHYYVQVIDYLREMAHALTFISNPSYDHIDNHHKGLIKAQVDELNELRDGTTELFDLIIHTIENNTIENIPDLIEKQQDVLNIIKASRKKQITRIKNQESGTRISILYLGILNELKTSCCNR
ncbi:MAG: phosphate permease, partial [Bacteroidota bacterium]